MLRNLKGLVPWLLTILISSGILKAADQANSPEERLRGMLRSTMLQLRDAQQRCRARRLKVIKKKRR
jgi:hypothetical protein